MDDNIRIKILELKADVFELIKKQEMLVIENNQLQEAKLKKVQEIQNLEFIHRDGPELGMR